MSAQPETDWIEWDTGKCPVDQSSIVEIILRAGGRSFTGPASLYNWRFNNDSGDIIAYRVVKP